MPAATWTDDLIVRPLDADTWTALAELVERHNGIFGGCWCTYFHSLARDEDRTYESKRDLECGLIEKGRRPGRSRLRRRRGRGVGRDGPPDELPNLHHRAQHEATQVSLPDYRVTCIFVDRRYGRRGLSALALKGSLDLIALAGGRVVEGYAHDMAKQPEGKKSRMTLTLPPA